MIMLGQTIKELREIHNISQTEIAHAAGCSPGTVGRVERGYYSDMALNVKLALNEIIHNRQQTIQQTNHAKTRFVGQCMRAQCGINLVADVADVPHRWVVAFHVDCGGYCPECAVAEGKGDVEKAEGILKRYPPNLLFTGEVKDGNKRAARIRVHHAIQKRPRWQFSKCA